MSNTSDISKTQSHEILVVDDKPANLTLLDTILSKQGYITRSAISGDFAIKSIGA